MRVFESLDAIPEHEFSGGTAVAIGKFDGVHLGHQMLLQRIFDVGAARGTDPVVFTFANNPLSFLRPELCPEPLMSKAQRLDVLAAEGVSSCVMVPFDADLAAVSAEDFVSQVLVGQLRVRHLCVGNDFRFGHGGTGDPVLLVQLGEELGFSVEVIGDVEDDALGKVSSSRVRAAIVQGDVASAARMLGRPTEVRGTVVRGDARGRELGFPTANLGGPLEGLVPADGVYAGWATVGDQTYAAAISVGANVTFDPDGESRVEAYLLDFAANIYGEEIAISFVERLRGMAAFATVDALVTRMHDDVRETRTLLGQ
ncbi:MAG: bifunctional riboflavin kinase/FAD synthetase [Microbacteriaceae bacterium]|nr:bifunctional riboflavin kinase/FAD synthetase [Microbacteriaceae bacterium]